MNIVLGSISALKTEAVQTAARKLDWNGTVNPVSAPSGVASQPVGEDETTRGAHQRAAGAQAQDPTSIAIGIESGIRQCNGAWEDWAVIVLRLPSGLEIVVHSEGVLVPTEVVDEVRVRGFATTTIGVVLHEWYSTTPDDPHPFLTRGQWSRSELLTVAVEQGLKRALEHIG